MSTTEATTATATGSTGRPTRASDDVRGRLEALEHQVATAAEILEVIDWERDAAAAIAAAIRSHMTEQPAPAGAARAARYGEWADQLEASVERRGLRLVRGASAPPAREIADREAWAAIAATAGEHLERRDLSPSGAAEMARLHRAATRAARSASELAG